ncbi:MAG TPA: hypothetical protein VMF31_03795 [Solirubrobacterales bacterium]|nr:hypothetical protein [Solirubrobacterales bacterium]
MTWSSPAAADDGSLTMTLDSGVINLGTTTGVKVIDPGATPPDPPATLNATLTEGGAVSTPTGGFVFPTKVIEDLSASGLLVDAKIEISATSTITGTFDRVTGASAITVPAQALISVYPADSTEDPLGVCRVSGFTLGLSTTGTLVDPGVPGATPPHPPANYPAAAFAPPSGDGAMVSLWAGLPASSAEGGSLPAVVCPAVDGLIGGSGGIWLGGTATPSAGPVQLPPSEAPDITAAPEVTTGSTAAEFEYEQGAGEDQPVNKFQCRLDSSASDAWEACGSGATSGSNEYSGLEPGEHKFDVRAGNDSGYGPVASHEWTIIAAPAVAPKILTSPPADGTDTSATFTFEKGMGEEQPVDGFECRLDSAAGWSACDSGSQTYSGLAVGDHEFEVRAGNEIGTGPVSSYSWKVSAVKPPDPTCAEDPSQSNCLGRLGRVAITPKSKKVKRGKAATFKVGVTNSGDGAARSVRACLTAPKKQLKTLGGACRTITSIDPGKTGTVTFKVRVTRKAKPGKKAIVKVKATGVGLNAVSAKATVKFAK